MEKSYKSRKEIKELAKKQLSPEFGMALVGYLLYSVMCSLLGGTGVGLFLLGSICLVGLYAIHIDILSGKKANIESLFHGFSKYNPSQLIGLSVLKNIFILLWSLLFIIPGIIKSYSYYLAELIAIKNPSLPSNDCINLSKELMKGKKWKLFMFDLSFFWWYLLVIISCGIAVIYVGPYHTHAKLSYIHHNIYSIYTEENTFTELEVL